jgi:hypothetical protein
MKLTAVLNARSGVIGVALAGACVVEKPMGFSGRNPCNRCKAYVNRNEKMLNEITHAV